MKFPRLERRLINEQLAKRTGFDSRTINAIMEEYNKIVKEALGAGFEVAIPNIGVLSFNVQKPKPAGEYWNGFAKMRVWRPASQGYYRLTIRPYLAMKNYLKGHTLFGEGCSDEEFEQYCTEMQKIYDEVYAPYREKKEEEKNE